MDQPQVFASGREITVFDPLDSAAGLSGTELLDASLVKRGDQWWMYLAGQVGGHGATDIFSASLPPGAPLSMSGWRPARSVTGEVSPLASRIRSRGWDGGGGRHCPSYVKGWDPGRQEWVERIYYAGAADQLWGPYTIGFLEWNGKEWLERAEPAFVANEDWEHGSVYEPNLIYHDGKWKMWYVAGANQEDYLVHGYAESDDGRSGWSKHEEFAAAEMKMFDFCVRARGNVFDAVFSRVWVKDSAAPPETGLWWCRAALASGKLSDWSTPVQILEAQIPGFHGGPWKPSFQFCQPDSERLILFFDRMRSTGEPGPFPFVFTLRGVELDLPQRP